MFLMGRYVTLYVTLCSTANKDMICPSSVKYVHTYEQDNASNNSTGQGKQVETPSWRKYMN